METPHIDTNLLVDRDEFTRALRTVMKGCGRRRVRVASLRFEDGCLHICAGTVLATIPAQGSWPWTVTTGYAWISKLADKPLQSNPVRIYVENARVYAERFSCPCKLPDSDATLSPEIPEPNRELAIQRAAKILAPLLVSFDHLEQIVNQAAARKPLWREDDRNVIARVAKAWAELAPLGVEPGDFQNALQSASHNAWRTMTRRHNSHQLYLEERRQARLKAKPA